MREVLLTTRRTLLAGAGAAALGLPRAQAAAGGTITVATVGDPGGLEPMLTTADLTSEIDQHVYETLYAFDLDFHPVPLLAAAMPEISPDARRYVIPLREGVKFHDGTDFTADDMVACLQRWLKVSPRGRPAAPSVEAIAATGPHTLQITLKQPYSPLMMLLCYYSAPAIAMPKRLAGSLEPVKEIIGTGPYKLIEYKPDQYIRMGRFAGYQSPAGSPSGAAGARQAVAEEIRFVPVPNPATRADGLISGEYHFADVLTTESYRKLGDHLNVAQGTMRVPGWALFVMNTRAGVLADERLRRAVMAALSPKDMLAAAFGDPSLWVAEGQIYPKGTDWYIPEAPGYDQHDPAKAAAMLKQAGYDGKPVRILTTTQYDYMYKLVQVATANLQEAGFNVDMQVMDWATLLQRRAKPELWEAFVTSGGVVPEPTLFSMFNPAYPGWWDTPAKRAALDSFVTAADQAQRMAAWKKLHELFFAEVPTVVIGYFKYLFGISRKLQNFTPVQPPAFWNVTVGA